VKRRLPIPVWSAGVLILAGMGVLIEEGSGMLNAGDLAPDFSARTEAGDSIRLSDFRGRKNVVLSFYPGDFTAGCTKQVCSYRDNIDRITSLNAVLFGISHDDQESHTRFKEQYALPFSLISDTDGSLSRLFGAARFGGLVRIVKRVTFVVDTSGVVRNVIHHEFAIGRHVDDVVETLERLNMPRR
jgi:peroxiredoxin Q/BCP